MRLINGLVNVFQGRKIGKTQVWNVAPKAFGFATLGLAAICLRGETNSPSEGETSMRESLAKASLI